MQNSLPHWRCIRLYLPQRRITRLTTAYGGASPPGEAFWRLRQCSNLVSWLNKSTTIKAFSYMGEGVERAAGRMRGLDSILPAAWKNLNRSVIKETLRGQRSTCIAIRRLRSFTLLYLYRRTRSPRRPFSFSSTKTFAVRATFLRRTPLTARFCPPGAF